MTSHRFFNVQSKKSNKAAGGSPVICDICQVEVVNWTSSGWEAGKCLTEDLARAVIAANIHEHTPSSDDACRRPHLIKVNRPWNSQRALKDNFNKAAGIVHQWKQQGVPLRVRYYIGHNHHELAAYLLSHHSISTSVVVPRREQDECTTEDQPPSAKQKAVVDDSGTKHLD
jgi:hypothetical protein